jgi:hypothetical protein
MKNNTQLVEEIENKYDVKSIKYKDLHLWLEIRNRFFSKLFFGEESLLKINRQTYYHVLVNAFYGFFNWFKSYDTWFFCSKINRIEIEGMYYDRLFDYLGTRTGKSLFIELATDRHYKRKEVFSKNIVSRSPLILIEKFLSVFINVKKTKNLSVLNDLSAEYDVKVDTKYIVKKMVSQYYTMKLLLKIKKPKLVFLSPAYFTYGYVKALKESGVKVIESQHGVILKEHHGYNVYESFDSNYFVDFLLVFGENEKKIFEENNRSVKPKNVIPVGNFYLDYIKNNFKESETFTGLLNDYDKTFCVSLQELDIGEKIIPIIVNCAKHYPEYLFILKPRRNSVSYYYEKFELPKNVIPIADINVYQLIMSTDFHITVYSTCALEAPALGKKNIMVNIENKSKEIYGETLNNVLTTVFVENEIELIDLIKDMEISDKSSIENHHKNIVIKDYKENINNFLENIL